MYAGSSLAVGGNRPESVQPAGSSVAGCLPKSSRYFRFNRAHVAFASSRRTVDARSSMMRAASYSHSEDVSPSASAIRNSTLAEFEPENSVAAAGVDPAASTRSSAVEGNPDPNTTSSAVEMPVSFAMSLMNRPKSVAPLMPLTRSSHRTRSSGVSFMLRTHPRATASATSFTPSANAASLTNLFNGAATGT